MVKLFHPNLCALGWTDNRVADLDVLGGDPVGEFHRHPTDFCGKTSRSFAGGVDDSNHRFLDLLGHLFKLGPTKESEDSRGLQR